MLKKYRGKSTNFYCFSPFVMFATFFIEAALAIYVLAKYKLNAESRLIVLLLLFLAGFQLSEYLVCEGSSKYALLWSKVGFSLITLLPAFSLHLINKLKPSNNLSLAVNAGYAVSFAFIGYFLFANNILGTICGGNYIIFDMPQPQGAIYGIYYVLFVLAELIYAFALMRKAKDNLKRALKWMCIGLLSFSVPTALVVMILPTWIEGFPSIFCGFAIFYSLILAFKVSPLILKKSK